MGVASHFCFFWAFDAQIINGIANHEGREKMKKMKKAEPVKVLPFIVKFLSEGVTRL